MEGFLEGFMKLLEKFVEQFLKKTLGEISEASYHTFSKRTPRDISKEIP